MAGSMGNKKYLSEKNEELPLPKTLKNYFDKQDNIHTVLQEGRWACSRSQLLGVKSATHTHSSNTVTLGYITWFPKASSQEYIQDLLSVLQLPNPSLGQHPTIILKCSVRNSK